MTIEHPFNMSRIFFAMASPDACIESWIERSGHFCTHYLEFADVIVFPGGHDVTPSLYGQEKLKGTTTNWNRDLHEIAVYQEFNHIPKVGICRGSQFLNVMAGGSLWQDVDRHGISGTHRVWCSLTHTVYDVTSTHHQQMIPAPHGEVLATANLSTRKVSDQGQYSFKRDSNLIIGGDDIEAVWYPEEESLCYQPHPEYRGNASCEFHFWTLFEETIYPLVQANKGITQGVGKDNKEKVT